MKKNRQRLLILGASGLLGSTFLKSEHFSEWEVLGHKGRLNDGVSTDLCSLEDANALLDSVSPDIILNLVGLTNVEHCEELPDDAYRVNVKTVENVVRWIREQDKSIYYIHISTDQVYDGKGPHEEDSISLKNYYGFSKYAGELVARSINSLILRSNFFGKSKCKGRVSFSDWLYDSLLGDRPIQVLKDVHFSPLSMDTLAKMLCLAIKKDIRGTYNLGSKQGLSKADFALCFARELEMNSELMSITTTDRVDFLKTYRPNDMRMSVDKFQSAVGVNLPLLVDEIKKVTLEYKNEYEN